tara:strand:- start:312 stop:803 length:492 start_codon:yes stop_codon:yes gene_type:complete
MTVFKKKFYSFILILPLLFFIDRLSKIIILNYFETSLETYIKITSFLNLVLVWNSGVGFGLFSFEENIAYNIITFFVLLVIILIFYLSLKTNDIKFYFYLIIIGGALGNFFDRILYSAVPDFIDFHIGNFHWFVFNIADIFITVGIICLIIAEIMLNKEINEK